MAHWYTLAEAKAAWQGLGVPDETTMQELLDVSQAECEAFSPVADEDDIPIGHRVAHLQHARNIWNSQKATPTSQPTDDFGSFSVTSFPLDWDVRARLRPRVVFGGPVG